MQGDAKTLKFLNQTLKNELTAINQYFLHSRMFGNWGLERLEKKEYEESIDEMKHADRLAKRILFLEGLPNFQDLGRLKIGETVREILEADLALELDGLPVLREAVVHCESIRDFVTRELFVDILQSEEEHVDWLETQIDLMTRMGDQNYIQSQMKDDED